jgi:hypothetical protein
VESLAVVIISSPKRVAVTLMRVVQSVMEQDPDEVLVVGDSPVPVPCRSLGVSPMTHSTIDALVKRDVGAVATRSENICYLCDDHTLGPDFVRTFRDRYATQEWDLLAPARFTVRNQLAIPLNVGKDLGYIGGHCGIYRRSILRHVPWSTARHHPNWDLWHSHDLVKAGGKLVYAEIDLSVEDVEPGARPWM